MKTRGQKALINTVVLAIYQIVTFVCGLILPRWILAYFGSEFNGISSSITHFLGLISILQMGIAGSTRFALYQVLADRDENGISGIVNATERYMRRVGLALLVYIAVLTLIYPLAAHTELPDGQVRLLILILGASSFAQYFFGVTYQILLTADQRQYVYYILSTLSTFANVVIAMALMRAGCSLFTVKLGSAVVFAISPVVLSLLVKRQYRIDKRVRPDNRGLAGRWDVLWHSLANIVSENTGLVALTLFADVKLVSVYTVYYLVVNGLQKVLTVFTGSLEAFFGNLFARKEQDRAYRHLESYEFFMCAFVSVVFSCALVLILPFVKLYTAGIRDVNYTEPVFAFAALTGQMVMCIRQPYLTVVQAAGHYRQTRGSAVAEAGINILVTTLLIRGYGLAGVAAGTLAANSVRTGYYLYYLERNILFRPMKRAMCMMLWTAANVSVIVLLCTGLIRLFAITTWMEWAVMGMACAALAAVVTLGSAAVFCRKKLHALIRTLLNTIYTKKRGIKGA